MRLRDKITSNFRVENFTKRVENYKKWVNRRTKRRVLFLKQKKSKKHCCFQQQRVSDSTKLFLWGRGSNHQSQHCCDMHDYLVWQAPFLIHQRHHLGTLLVYGPTRYRQGRSDFLTLPVNVVQQVVNGEYGESQDLWQWKCWMRGVPFACWCRQQRCLALLLLTGYVTAIISFWVSLSSFIPPFVIFYLLVGVYVFTSTS